MEVGGWFVEVEEGNVGKVYGGEWYVSYRCEGDVGDVGVLLRSELGECIYVRKCGCLLIEY